MKRSLIALTVVTLTAGSALAAPGDPRVLEGTLQWPPTLAGEPFVVIRGDDGGTYYADLSSAQRRAGGPLAAGSRVAVLGIEGNRPHEVAAIAFGAGDAAALGLPAPGGAAAVPAPSASVPSTPPAPAPSTVSPPGAPAPGPRAEPMWRLDGTVQSVSGTSVTLRSVQGASYIVDVSPLSEATVQALRPGDRVSLFGVPRDDGRLVANGYVQSESGAPAASPRPGR